MTLLELLSRNKNYSFNSDPGTDKESQHYYVSSFYDEAFLPYKEKEVNVLEIGINTGGSLLLWRDYFINGKIFGVDLINCIQRPYDFSFGDYPYEYVDTVNFKNIKMFFEDAYSEVFLSKIPSMDIIIDDGPHSFESQIKCLNMFLPKLKTNGLFVIEDIADLNYIKDFEKLISKIDSPVRTEIIDTREQYNNFDNIIFAVWKL